MMKQKKRKQTLNNEKTHINYGASNDETNEPERGLTEKPQNLTILDLPDPLDKVDCAAYRRTLSQQKKFITFDKKGYFHKIAKVTCTMIFNNHVRHNSFKNHDNRVIS